MSVLGWKIEGNNSTVCSLYKAQFVFRVFLKSRDKAIRRCILEQYYWLQFFTDIQYQPEIPFQFHRDRRIMRKSEKEVQEIGQETLQSGRVVRSRASNDITFYDIDFESYEIKIEIKLEAHVT